MGEWTDKAKGKAKEIGGVVSGNRKMEAEGKLDQVKGAVKGKVEDVKHGGSNRASEPTRSK